MPMTVLRTLIALGVTALMLVTATPVFAQQTYPTVAGLEEYSEATMFMSLPGYLRLLVYEQTRQWISYAEAERIVEEQRRLAGG